MSLRAISTTGFAILVACGAPEHAPRSAATGARAAEAESGAADPPSAVLTQTPAFDPVRADSLGDLAVCFVGSRYVVLEQRLEESVGSDLFVRPNDEAAEPASLCAADSLGGDIVLRNQWAQYFLGLKGDLLFIDDGTGPGGRVLTIYDLTKRDTVFTLPGYHLIGWSDATTLRLWKEASYGEAVAGICPDTVYSMQPALDSLVELDLRTLRLRPTGETRCYFIS